MVGVDDPDQDDAANSADSVQSWANVGHVVRDESGEVTCAALSWNGDSDPKAARDGVFALTAALEDLMRQDPTLGLGPTVRTEFGTQHDLTSSRETAARPRCSSSRSASTPASEAPPPGEAHGRAEDRQGQERVR
jgi:hypothetical protein